MTIDYDVVIIGGNLTGRYAASYAAKLHAKVALIEPRINHSELNYNQTINELSKNKNTLCNTLDIDLTKPPTVTWSDVILYADAVTAHLEQMDSLANLVALGVDVIIGDGTFLASPKLLITVNQRLLHGRTYLLANGTVPIIPKIAGLATTNYLTPANIWPSLDKINLPQNWVVIGGTPQSIEISQTLTRLGCHVILIMKSSLFLTQIEPEIARILLTQLEVNGIEILADLEVTQIQQVADKKVLHIGDQTIVTDEILVASGQRANLTSLNLPAVGVKQHQHRLIINHQLQTTNNRIYACGNVIGGYDLVNIGNYEAKIALKNALFLPIYPVNYRHIPWIIHSQPILAQVGLTAAQAKVHYPQDEILVLKQYFKVLAATQTQTETTGVCQFVVWENGQILGASILGIEARELINLIALAMSKNMAVKDIANLAPIYPSFTEILVKTAEEWHRYRLEKNYALQEFLANFFYFRRDWNL